MGDGTNIGGGRHPSATETAGSRTNPSRESTLEVWKKRIAATHEFLLLVDSDFRIRFVNRMQVGHPDARGRSIFDYIDPDDRDQAGKALRDALSTGFPQTYEARGVGPGQEVSSYSVWVMPLEREIEGASLVLVSSDVSHTKRVERELEEERQLMLSIVAHAPDMMIIVDRDHRVLFINHTELGYTREQVIGREVEDFVPSSHRAELHAAVERVFETGQTATFESNATGPDGEQYFTTRLGPMNRGGRVSQVLLLPTNITARVKAEQERERERESLRLSEARFRTLVDHSPEAITILDVDEDRFVDVNEVACRTLGRSREELLAASPPEVSPEFQPDGSRSEISVRELVNQALAGESPTFEWMHQRPSGELVPCEIRLVRLPHPERRLVRGSVSDISARKQAEVERQRLTEELFQAQKLQAIGQLTGGVAHDFNNLLTVISGSLELIELDSDPEDAVRTHASEAMSAVLRAAELTQQLLAFARRQPLRPRIVDVNRLVADAEGMLRRTLGETIAVQAALAEDIWVCEVDPAQLENAILNLAINARDAMPQGGRLTIETKNTRLTREGSAKHPGVDAGDYVMLSLTDDGAGMDAAVLSQAFEPFFTTKEVGHGSGLGLSMVYGFAKQSGGYATIESKPGAGTSVRIFIPRSSSTDHGAAEDPSPLPVLRGEGRLILVVEDDASVRVLVVRMLERLGYRTLSASDAKTALEVLRHATDVALVLSDMVLGGTTHGVELGRRIHALRPELPVIFMSGYTKDVVPEGGLDDGISLIEKPFTHHRLAETVHRALAR